MKTSTLLTLLLALSCGLAYAEPPQPGSYRNGYGSLDITRDKGKLRFAIEALGGNAHTCSLSGTIDANGKSQADDGDAQHPCLVTFKPIARGYAVASNEFCRDFCGMRASFDADYVKPLPGCMPTEITATRKRFLASYKARQYADAQKLLLPVVVNCKEVMDRFEDGWVRNDLALAQYHLGDSASCRQTLAPLVELAQDQEPGAGEPSFQDALLSLAKASRTNLKLCGAPVKLP